MPHKKAVDIARGFGGFCIVSVLYMFALAIALQLLKDMHIGPQAPLIVQCVALVVASLTITTLTVWEIVLVNRWSLTWFIDLPRSV